MKLTKKIVNIILIVFLGLIFTSCKEETDPNEIFLDLPTILEVEIDDEDLINQVLEKYEQLSQSEKEKVTIDNLNKLDELQEKINELKSEQNTYEDLVAKIKQIEADFSLEKTSVYQELKSQYQSLPESIKNNSSEIDAIFLRIDELIEELSYEKVITMLDELIVLSEDQLTSALLQEVISNYDLLSDANKEKLSSTYLDLINEYRILLGELQEVDIVRNGLLSLPSIEEVTLDYLDTITNIREVYRSLSSSQKKYISQELEFLLMDYEIRMQELRDEQLLIVEEESIELVALELENLIPNEFTTSVAFPQVITINSIRFTLFWTTSSRYLNYLGELFSPLEDTKLTINVRIQGPNFEEDYSKEVVLIGKGIIEMPEIKEGQMLTFTYLRNKDAAQDCLYERDFSKLDVINYSFARIVDGKLSVTSLSNLSKIVQLREKGVRIVITVDGVSEDTANAFSKAAATPASRTTFANSLLEVADTYQIDGFDLDWEINVQSANFVLLCREIKRVFQTYDRDLLLTAAVGVATDAYASVAKDLSTCLDYLHIMTYGMGSTQSARHETALYSGSYATYSVDYAVNKYINAGFPRNKLTFGIQFYVRMVTLADAPADPFGKSSVSASSISYKSFLENYYNSNRSLERYDLSTGSYYWYDGRTFASYDNPQSIKLKCDYAKNMGIAGIMYWDYGHDLTGTLLDAIYKEFKYQQN